MYSIFFYLPNFGMFFSPFTFYFLLLFVPLPPGKNVSHISIQYQYLKYVYDISI